MEWSREFPFELYVCRWVERHWPPTRDRDDPVLVGRQLGTSNRRWDTVVVIAREQALRQRAAFGPEALDQDLLRVVRHAPADWAWYRDAIPDPGFAWRYVRAAVHRAEARGIIDTRKTSGRLQYRRRWRYPEWPAAVVAIENKPDLDASAARRLNDQLEYDVQLGLADETWVATRQTDRTVEPALLEDIPVEAGILTVDPASDSADQLWHAHRLATDTTGSRADGTTVSPEWKTTKRLLIAERLYERGWRSYVDSMRPDCRHFGLKEVATGLLPTCDAKGRCPTQRECAASCPAFEPEPPTWRTHDWPIEGGPGRRYQRVLSDRRQRRRLSRED